MNDHTGIITEWADIEVSVRNVDLSFTATSKEPLLSQASPSCSKDLQ